MCCFSFHLLGLERDYITTIHRCAVLVHTANRLCVLVSVCMRSRLCVHSLIHSFIKIRIIFHTQICTLARTCVILWVPCVRAVLLQIIYIYVYAQHISVREHSSGSTHHIRLSRSCALTISFSALCVFVYSVWCFTCSVDFFLGWFFSSFFLYRLLCVIVECVDTGDGRMCVCAHRGEFYNEFWLFDCCRARCSVTQKKINTKYNSRATARHIACV